MNHSTSFFGQIYVIWKVCQAYFIIIIYYRNSCTWSWSTLFANVSSMERQTSIFAEQMWVAFAVQKLLTFFQQKISEYCILNPLKQLTKWPLTNSLS